MMTKYKGDVMLPKRSMKAEKDMMSQCPHCAGGCPP